MARIVSIFLGVVATLSTVSCGSDPTSDGITSSTAVDKPLYTIGETPGFTNLSTAKAALGASPATLRYAADQSVNTLTIPSNVELQPVDGALVTVAPGKTLALPDAVTVRWPRRQIFAGTGTVAGLSRTVPQWWGAKGDGATDDTVPIITALSAGKGKLVEFPGGHTYITNGTLLQFYGGTTITGYGATLKLKPGEYSGHAYFLGNSKTISYAAEDPRTSAVAIYGITIDGNIGNVTTSASCTGVHVYKQDGLTMEDVSIRDLPGVTGGGYGFITSMSNDIYLARCSIGRTDRSNIYLWESRNCNITDCELNGSYYRDCITIGTNKDIQLQSTSFAMKGCRLRSSLPTATHGIRCSGSVTGTISDTSLSGYLADDGGGSGATATAVISGGAVTGIIPGAGGSGYATAPEIRINGGGGRIAKATAVLTGDAVTGYLVTDGGSGYSSVPKVEVGTGTEGIYFTSALSQSVTVSNVRIDNVHHGVLIESAAAKNIELNNLEIGSGSACRNGIRSLGSGTILKVNGGTIKTVRQPLYVAYSPDFSVTGVTFSGGSSALFMSAQQGGTAVFRDNIITRLTSPRYAVLVAGDVAAAEVAGNVLRDNANDEIYFASPGQVLNKVVPVSPTAGTVVPGSGPWIR
jgi:hypothetical protein